MASLLVILFILGIAVYQYLKGTFVKAFAMIITTICAGIVAFAYFETLARFFIRQELFLLWAQPLSFLLLFILAFAVLQTVVSLLTRNPIDLGPWAEHIGRVVFGGLSGLIISGLLLTALAIAPLSNKMPYQRFDPTRPNAEEPNKALLNTDGFATGWFSLISRGSFSGKRSFATLHPAFLDQLFLNRCKIEDTEISTVTIPNAIEIPKKEAVWPAPEGLKNSNGEPIQQKNGHKLMIVRVGITEKAVRNDGVFTLSQLRLICKQKSNTNKLLSGKGINIYPIGYLKTIKHLQIKPLDDKIKIVSDDLDNSVRWLDLAIYVPDDFVPVLFEFRQNSIAQLPLPVTGEQAPAPAPFVGVSDCTTDIAELEPISSARIYGVELATGYQFLQELELEISDPNQWETAQTDNSIKPAQFEEGKINCVRAELNMGKIKEQEDKNKAAQKKTRRRQKGFAGMLKPLEGYSLLSLKCNNPSTGSAIESQQLPVLEEPTGKTHPPVGIIASGKVGDQIIYEVDYCAVKGKDVKDGSTTSKEDTVIEPFTGTFWLTEKAKSISECYLLYLIKSDKHIIITSVRPNDVEVSAGFKGCQGFLVN